MGAETRLGLELVCGQDKYAHLRLPSEAKTLCRQPARPGMPSHSATMCHVCALERAELEYAVAER